MKLGLVGFGFGGRFFHAPFITAADGVELAGIVTRSPARRAEAAAEYPGVPLYLDAGRTDSGFFVTIVHRNGVKSHVSATKSNRLVAREMRLLGSDGSYVSQQSDVQAVAAIAGRRPADEPAAWGYEDESRWGTLTTAAGQFRVPSEQGAYQAYYEQFALAVAGKGPEPVPGTEGVHTLEVLDAARLSDAERRSVDIEG